nr:unnamed protein product [Digitaria exilis]
MRKHGSTARRSNTTSSPPLPTRTESNCSLGFGFVSAPVVPAASATRPAMTLHRNMARLPVAGAPLPPRALACAPPLPSKVRMRGASSSPPPAAAEGDEPCGGAGEKRIISLPSAALRESSNLATARAGLWTRNSISTTPGNALLLVVGGAPGCCGGCETGAGRGDHEERKMISTTCRDEWPAGSSVSAGRGPRGPGGGDSGGNTEVGFGFLPVSGLGFDPGCFGRLGLPVDFEEATWVRAASPELPQPARGRSGWSFLGGAGATLAATSSAAVDLQWRERTQLPASVGRRRGGGGLSGIRRAQLEMQRAPRGRCG